MSPRLKIWLAVVMYMLVASRLSNVGLLVFTVLVGAFACIWSMQGHGERVRKFYLARGQCPKCHYDLRGITANRCPECGEYIESSPTSSPALPAEKPVRGPDGIVAEPDESDL